MHCSSSSTGVGEALPVATTFKFRDVNTGRFDFEKARRHPLWFNELKGFEDHVPETEEYGVRSFVYRARRPFHPARFQAFCNEPWPGVIRAKGFFWLAPVRVSSANSRMPAQW